ncbi:MULTISPECIES: nitroreductase [Rhodococcus]|uniref:Nitroreductase n=1 Tax=Rhodococcus qingshengii JCM 15477 TaxID=1303681 RepID=A0AB38RNS4_RHOSG|nr:MULTISPECIES: nitroreductase [Rhodococcus]MDA3635156.1 nitroreductase [Rhodococcus sp. C-2]UPU46498.1 nitroreductase [Rhodococcus qingshengii JCM 15477]
MSLSTLLSSRYSCRAFLPAQVDEETLNERFTLAQRTPSWCNTQPWQVYVTSGDATTQLAEALSVYATSQEPVSCLQLPVGYTGVRADRRREAGYGLYSALGIERSDREGRDAQMARNFDFFGAPHTAVITSAAELGVYGAVDCGAYVSTLLLATQELGLGAVAQGAIAFHTDVVRSELGIPEDQHIVCTVSFGHADTTHPVNAFRTTRADVHEAVHHVNTTGASL